MKVAHLSSAHKTRDIRIFHKECKSLARAGHDVYLIVRHDDNFEEDGVKVIGVGHSPPSRLKRMTSTVNRVYKKAIEINADVYHFHDPELLRVAMKLKRKGKKVVYDVHEDLPRQIISKDWIPKLVRKVIASLFEKYENRTARKLKAVVTATPFINDRFEKIGCRAVNINNYPILSELHLPGQNWSDKEKAICYIGGISRIRGIIEMVKALEGTDIKLYLGGAFENDSLYEEAKLTPGWENVEELGFVDRKDIREVFRKVMGGVVLFHDQPNHVNAQPNKMFEYMSAGLPVIGSHFPLWRSILEANHCGICVDPHDSSKIKEAFQNLVGSPEKAKIMGENGRKAVEQKYNWENEEKKLVRLYSSFVPGS